MDGAGFHFFDDSTRGKSTVAKAACSVWGYFGKYARTWKATSNGIEGAALLFNDGLMILDEIGDGDAKEISDTLYLLGNGKGKQRATVLGNARAVNTFRVVVLSNGEHTMQAHLAKKGLVVKAGQLARFPQIPLFGKYGAFDDLHGYQGGAAFSAAIVSKAAECYGVAGRAYLEQLTQDTDTQPNNSMTRLMSLLSVLEHYHHKKNGLLNPLP
jgi:putative DNA primase/helicase